MKNGQTSARATPEMDKKVRALPRKWTKKCARPWRDMLFSLGNRGIFASTKAHHPSQGIGGGRCGVGNAATTNPSSSHVRGQVECSVTGNRIVRLTGSTFCRYGSIRR